MSVMSLRYLQVANSRGWHVYVNRECFTDHFGRQNK